MNQSRARQIVRDMGLVGLGLTPARSGRVGQN